MSDQEHNVYATPKTAPLVEAEEAELAGRGLRFAA